MAASPLVSAGWLAQRMKEGLGAIKILDGEHIMNCMQHTHSINNLIYHIDNISL